MSANFQKTDEGWLKSILRQGNISKDEEAIIEAAFDAQTDHDIEDIKRQAVYEVFLRKVCLHRMLLSPIEIPVMALILGLTEAKDHLRVIKIYFKYFTKKMSLQDFREALVVIDSKRTLQ